MNAENEAMRGILITGASGMLGSALTVACARTFPEARIVACDLRAPTASLRAASGTCQWIVQDLCDPDTVDACFALLKPCDSIFVYHLAAYYDFEIKWHAAYQKNNCELITRLCEACIEYKVSRIVFASSIAVYAASDYSEHMDEKTLASGCLPILDIGYLGKVQSR